VVAALAQRPELWRDPVPCLAAHDDGVTMPRGNGRRLARRH
jgi:hypothetical protein